MENGATIISKINQTPYNITIDANHIDLYGAVTYNMLNSGMKAELDAKAKKGEITQTDLAYSLQLKINTMSSDIASKVNASALKAFSLNNGPGITKADFVAALQTELTGKLAGSSTVSGNKLASIIVNGQTLIAGGYIQAEYINVNNLTVNEALKIGSFSVSGYSLISQGTNTRIDLSSGSIVLTHNLGQQTILNGSIGNLSFGKTEIIPTNGKDLFLSASYSAGGAGRMVNLMFVNMSGDASWYCRTVIQMSHMPLLNHLSNIPDVPNKIGTGNRAVRWDERTGYFMFNNIIKKRL